MPTIADILTFMNMINLMLGRVEHEKTFNSLGARSISIYMQILYKPVADECSHTQWACRCVS